MRIRWVILLLLLWTKVGFSQDSLSIMYYNLLKFPAELPERIIDLRQVLGYAQPDILVVNELTSSSGATVILNEGLNVFGEDRYAAATYYDGTDTDNMLFYNQDKLGLVSQEEIPTGLREISAYQLYYKHPELGPLADTIYLHVFGMHLKAGAGYFDQRKAEALTLKYYLNDQGTPENIIAGGDFNFYSGFESGCQAMLDGAGVNLYDPIDQIGNWSNNDGYADIHTQSTRTASFGGGAGGGMDDRFDLIFISEDVFNNENGLTFLEGSYQALGQDGGRFNASIITPFNASLPDSVSSALYYASDHLPVLLRVVTDYTANTHEEKLTAASIQVKYNAYGHHFAFSKTVQNGELIIYNQIGQLIDRYNVKNTNLTTIQKSLKPGLYYLQAQLDGEQVRYKFLILN